MDEQRLNQFVGQMLGDLGGAFGIALVRMGTTLGLYDLIDSEGPITSDALAAKAGVTERYLREWLAYHAASGYVTYEPGSETYRFSPEQRAVFADRSSPVFLLPAFDAAAGYVMNEDALARAYRSGEGIAWSETTGCIFCAVAGFFRPTYEANLLSSWLPALDGVVARLERGARVADVGCGHGHSTILMAEAFPNSEFVGFDFHEPSIEEARAHATRHGVANARFEVATAKGFPGRYDLVTFFDSLHDMGDPRGAAAHVRQALSPGGTFMVVEPQAADRLEDNLNPVGRLYYAGSAQLCVPTSMAQETRAALGAQAGEKRLAEVITAGGFSSVRRATETPFSMVLEARP